MRPSTASRCMRARASTMRSSVSAASGRPRLQSGSCGMAFASMAAILQVEPLVVKTSSLHTFQKNDNVYVGSRHEVEDKHSTFVVLNVTNQTLTLVNAYGNYNKAAMVQIMEYCAIHLCETVQVTDTIKGMLQNTRDNSRYIA